MNAVYGSIIENLKLIDIVYEQTADIFKKDRTNTSDSKEVTVAEFIQSYLPADFQVKLRSKIYSKTQETNNIDCVVLSPNHPKLITPKREIVLAEGVFVAVEIKPDISTLTVKSEFFKGLKQIQSVKNIIRSVERIDIWKLTGGKKPSEYYDKIPSVIFTSKSSTFDKTINFIAKKVKDNTIGVQELPDLIVCLDKGIIFYSPIFKETSLARHFEEKGMKNLPDKAFVTYESDNKSSILILFLRYFLNFNSTYLLPSKFIVKEYLNEIETNFTMKLYDLDKVSDTK